MKALRILVILMLTCLALSSGSAHAATWNWVGSDDKTGWFYDIDEICFAKKSPSNLWNATVLPNIPEPDVTNVIFWAKVVYTPKGAAERATYTNDPYLYKLRENISLLSISIPNKTITTYATTGYTNEGSVIYSDEYTYTERIYPNSWGEALYNDVVQYAREHHDVLRWHTTGLPW